MEKANHPVLNKAEWQHALPNILSSKRIVEMTFHVPKVDKDMEFITADAMAAALEHYRYFPIISEFHKERPIGIAEKIWQTDNDEFKAIARIREDASVDDVWDKISHGLYNQVSIAGRRTEYSQECNIHKSLRSEQRPCRTTGLRLDSISVCDEAARNDNTDLAVVKASADDPLAFVYTTALELTQVKDTLIKAETTNSELIHPVTDGTKRKQGDTMKKCNQPPVKKGDEEEEKKEEIKEEEAEKEEKADESGTSEEEEKADEPETSEKEEKEKEEKAEPGLGELVTMIKDMKATLDQLVSSDKKVHESMKADEPEDEKKEEKKVEKAETPPPNPAQDPEGDGNLKKAEMEQDFKKALDAAIAPLNTEIADLKKALLDTNAKLEEYANEGISKAKLPIMYLKTDQEGKPELGNAGAVAAISKKKGGTK